MINMIVQDAEDFRQQLPETGLFEILDCAVLVEASDFTPVHEIETISKYLHYAINVVDFKVVPISERMDHGDIHISIAEVPVHIAENRPKRDPGPKKS